MSNAAGAFIPDWSIVPSLTYLHSAGDLFLSRGNVDAEHEKLFQEVAQDLSIEDRNIKIKNSGWLLRILTGYNNAISVQLFNRVYINNSELRKMSLGEKKFLKAHELTHQQKNHYYKVIITSIFLAVLKTSTQKSLRSVDNGLIKKYCTDGFGIPLLCTFGLWQLLEAQIKQSHEREADREAILTVGVHPEDGVSYLDNYLCHPDTRDWPLFFSFFQKIQNLIMPLLSLPIIKQHMPHLVSFEDRVALLRALEVEWQLRHGNKSYADAVVVQ